VGAHRPMTPETTPPYQEEFARWGVAQGMRIRRICSTSLSRSPGDRVLSQGDDIGIITISGGAGVWAGRRHVTQRGLSVPELRAETQERLEGTHPQLWLPPKSRRRYRSGLRRGGDRACPSIMLCHRPEVECGRAGLSLASPRMLDGSESEIARGARSLG